MNLRTSSTGDFKEEHKLFPHNLNVKILYGILLWYNNEEIYEIL